MSSSSMGMGSGFGIKNCLFTAIFLYNELVRFLCSCCLDYQCFYHNMKGMHMTSQHLELPLGGIKLLE